jgi:hypothetical protein
MAFLPTPQSNSTPQKPHDRALNKQTSPRRTGRASSAAKRAKNRTTVMSAVPRGNHTAQRPLNPRQRLATAKCGEWAGVSKNTALGGIAGGPCAMFADAPRTNHAPVGKRSRNSRGGRRRVALAMTVGRQAWGARLVSRAERRSRRRRSARRFF